MKHLRLQPCRRHLPSVLFACVATARFFPASSSRPCPRSDFHLFTPLSVPHLLLKRHPKAKRGIAQAGTRKSETNTAVGNFISILQQRDSVMQSKCHASLSLLPGIERFSNPQERVNDPIHDALLSPSLLPLPDSQNRPEAGADRAALPPFRHNYRI